MLGGQDILWEGNIKKNKIDLYSSRGMQIISLYFFAKSVKRCAYLDLHRAMVRVHTLVR